MKRIRLGVLVAFGVALPLLGVPTASAVATPTTPYPGGTWQPPAPSFGESTDANRSVMMDDGAVLKVDVSYPTSLKSGKRLPGPFPVILNQDPYSSSGISPSGSSYYVERGFIWVHVHDRGTGGPGPGESEGATDITFGPRMGLDGVAMAYWAADPNNVPGSNGVIGLQGCSALGEIQFSTLSRLGELLRTKGRISVPGDTVDAARRSVAVTARTNPIKAAIPNCFVTNEYRQVFTDNGVGTTQTATIAVIGAAALAPLFGVNTNTPSSSLTINQIGLDYMTGGDSYGYYRQFWRDRDWLLHADDIGRTGVPILLWVGWGEGGFMGAQPMYAALQNVAAGRPVAAPMSPTQKTSPKYQAIVGDWAHGGGLDPGIELEWFQTWMQGVNTGLRSAPGSLMLEELSGDASRRWIAPRTYPMTTRYQALHLGDNGSAPTGSGTLSTAKPSGHGSDQIVWTPGPGAQLTYTAPPVGQDTTLLGPGAAELWVQSSTTNVQLYVELDDVSPSGTVTEITHGSILGSRSKLDPTRSWTAPNGLPIQPYLTLDADRLLNANAPVKLDVPLAEVTWKLRAGHRLRVVVGPNPGTLCGPTQVVSAGVAAAIVSRPYGCVVPVPVQRSLVGGVFQILHGPDYPSLLNLPLMPSSQIPTVRSASTPTSDGVVLPQHWGGSRARR